MCVISFCKINIYKWILRYFINFINIEKLEDFIIKADSFNLKIKITGEKRHYRQYCISLDSTNLLIFSDMIYRALFVRPSL